MLMCNKHHKFVQNNQTQLLKMKKIIFTLMCALMVIAANAQDLNSKGDNILGNYLSIKDGGKSKIKITKEADGTYKAQVYWVERALDGSVEIYCG